MEQSEQPEQPEQPEHSQEKKPREITSIFLKLLEYTPKDHHLYQFIVEQIESYKDLQQQANNFMMNVISNPSLYYYKPPELTYPEPFQTLQNRKIQCLKNFCIKAQETFLDEDTLEFKTWGCAIQAIILNEPIPDGIHKQNHTI
jgi:hypothetical protein